MKEGDMLWWFDVCVVTFPCFDIDLTSTVF